jgi:hypothetical protein
VTVPVFRSTILSQFQKLRKVFECCAESDSRYGLTGISWIIVIIPRSLHQPALTDIVKK